MIQGRILGMVFFNPSLRTRTSFEAAMLRFGGHAITLSAGGDTWRLEHRDGVVMDGDCSEHVREAAAVLGRYCDVLGVRSFAHMADAAEDAADPVLRAFAAHAGVPVVSLESAIEHPCQGLADQMTLVEKLGALRGQAAGADVGAAGEGTADGRFAFGNPRRGGRRNARDHRPSARLRTWHAVRRNGAAMVPRGRRVADDYPRPAGRLPRGGRDLCEKLGQPGAVWAAGRPGGQLPRARLLDGRPAAPGKPTTILMHCLPVRRNVVIADAALDDPRSVVIDQAENRMWAQAAVLCGLLKP